MNNLFMVVDATIRGNFNKLTRHRMPGAMPFGAKYRLIDFTLSNCKNSGIRNVAIFPYGNYRSLSDHIGSGDRWDLSRRKDGIFILQPKNLNLKSEDSISFQRMYEHIEYFMRSTQEYVVITPANIVWNIDYNDILNYHILRQADITEVLSIDGTRLKTFVLSKNLLLSFIRNYDDLQYRNLTEVFDYSPSMNKNVYVFESSCFFINTPEELFKANMALLEIDTRHQLFNPQRPIFSKETMSSPSRYGDNAFVKNSIIASGAVIEGTVYNSLIGRKAVIKKGAVVKNSVVMNQCVIEDDTLVQYSILDKETKVLKKAFVNGSIDDLFISEKKQIVVSDKGLKILQIAVECEPFVKTGGLADVVGALAQNFSKLGVESSVMMPLYPRIKDKYRVLLEMRVEAIIPYGTKNYKVTLYSYLNKNTNYYFIESYDFFDREMIYGYEDDGDRFAFFSKACLSLIDIFDELPDIIHIHDWHTGLIPLLIKKDEKAKNVKTLMTIHNIDYQGVHPAAILNRIGLTDVVSFQPTINFMELGLNNASTISTVSPTYHDELRYEYYSKNLVEIINRRDRDFYGILNGLSEEINPETDLAIKVPYSANTVFKNKPANKKYLQEIMNIETGDNLFVLGMVTRIVEQKGFDILIPALEEFMAQNNVEFVLLGTGEERYIQQLRALEEKYPSRFRLNIGYDATNPYYIYAGADAFLMPSRFEPCGTSQMISLKYGTIPIVRQTGGLNDTVEQFDAITKKGNGFKFYNYDSKDLLFQLHNALNLFTNTDRLLWNQLIQNAMSAHFSLEISAKSYVELYRAMIGINNQ